MNRYAVGFFASQKLQQVGAEPLMDLDRNTVDR